MPGETFKVSNAVLTNVHTADRCAADHCVIHNPSDHHMRDWPLIWRSDRRIMERQCPHGVGHPDPDDALARKALGIFDETGGTVHGCDGCCRATQEEPNDPSGEKQENHG